MKFRIGTRGSNLARWQADWVAESLHEIGVESETILIKTSGDIDLSSPIAELGAQGVFTKEIQKSLLENEIDIAVHSLKDLPSVPVPGLTLAAVPERGPAFDSFVSVKYGALEELPGNSVIGTGSVRRRMQLLYRYGNRFQLRDIRGNLETRLRKLDDGEYDAIILAEAGLIRLGLGSRIRESLVPPKFLPAVGQGALGIEVRSNDEATFEAVSRLNDPNSFAAVTAERAFLLAIQGGCSSPVAAHAKIEGMFLKIHARVISLDGARMFECFLTGTPEDAVKIGTELAGKLVTISKL